MRIALHLVDTHQMFVEWAVKTLRSVVFLVIFIFYWMFGLEGRCNAKWFMVQTITFRYIKMKPILILEFPNSWFKHLANSMNIWLLFSFSVYCEDLVCMSTARGEGRPPSIIWMERAGHQAQPNSGALVTVETLPDSCRGGSGVRWAPAQRPGAQKEGTGKRASLLMALWSPKHNPLSPLLFPKSI